MSKNNDNAITWDLDRMKEAIKSPSIEIPSGLSSGEIRAFILNASNHISQQEKQN